jgi:hypothetical protein
VRNSDKYSGLLNGRLKGSFEELHKAGCIQTGEDLPLEKAKEAVEFLFNQLMLATRLNPCDGCPAFNEGRCRAYLLFHTAQHELKRQRENRIQQATTPPGGESVAQIAKRLNISKSEVRRRKLRGDLL